MNPHRPLGPCWGRKYRGKTGSTDRSWGKEEKYVILLNYYRL